MDEANRSRGSKFRHRPWRGISRRVCDGKPGARRVYSQWASVKRGLCGIDGSGHSSDVEHFRAELHVHNFAEAEVLDDGKIHVLHWHCQNVLDTVDADKHIY